MSFEKDISSADHRADVSRRIASVMRLGGHMRLIPEAAKHRSRFRVIAAARAAIVTYDERSTQPSSDQSADNYHETHAGLEGSSVTEPAQGHDMTKPLEQPEMPSGEDSPREI